MSISPSDFAELVHAKQRVFEFTVHALIRAEKRLMQPQVCQEEILTKEPQVVEEQKKQYQGRT